jgi:hypothetical protein
MPQCAYRTKLGVGNGCTIHAGVDDDRDVQIRERAPARGAKRHARSVVRVRRMAVGQRVPRCPQPLRHLGRYTWALLRDQYLHGYSGLRFPADSLPRTIATGVAA